MLIDNFHDFIENFFNYVNENKIDIYNEFSLQHELGIFIREKFPQLPKYKVEFERNVSKFGFDKDKTQKKEIDIVISSHDEKEKYAIELKFPRNGQHPEQMYSFVKDIKFMEELQDNENLKYKEKLCFTNTYVLTLVDDDLFYKQNDNNKKDIYKIFRNKPCCVSGKILKPTKNDKEKIYIELKKSYYFERKKIDTIIDSEEKECRYYCIDLSKNLNK
ncbi:MAG: hypothetical protein IJV35_04525 [Neisseriaceae bacterium]|nr:hypothetical protein [Neisseriaceae bacterium]